MSRWPVYWQSENIIEKQASLFRPVNPEREEKERRLMEAADRLNLHYGRGTIRTATAGTRQTW